MASTNSDYQNKIWMTHYENLKNFQQSSSKLYPNAQDNTKLYHWCKNQRRFNKNNTLSQERIDLLNELNFIWEVVNTSFEKRIIELKHYEKEQGTLHVSQVAWQKGSPNHKLSRWVNEMRRLYNENRLSIERINKLNSIGFFWNMEDERFAKNLGKLKRFQKQNGHFDVPQSGRNKKLGEWIAQVRCRGLAKKHYIDALNDIGFVWEGKKKRLQKAKEVMTEIDIMNNLRRKEEPQIVHELEGVA